MGENAAIKLESNLRLKNQLLKKRIQHLKLGFKGRMIQITATIRK